MYIRRKKNTSGSISIYILEKQNGKQKLVKSMGAAHVESDIKQLESLARKEIEKLSKQKAIEFIYDQDVHQITENDTADVPFFDKVYPEIKKRLSGRTIVAHNESFDRGILQKTMADFGIDYSDLNIANRWECTMKIYRAKGYKPYKLNACCKINGIELNHHDALSDARACAMLYIKKDC